PTTPDNAAGWRIDPPVSVPSAPKAMSAATAAAAPPLDPPGTRERCQGLRVICTLEFSVDDPIANSSMSVRPTGIALCQRNLAINRIDPLLQSAKHFGRRNFVPPQQILDFDDAKRRQIAFRHSTTLVTMKRLLAWRGALLNACAGVNQSLALSSRKTLKIGTPWAAGSTPSTFTSFNLSA